MLKQLIVRIDPTLDAQLAHLAIDLKTSKQALVTEAIEALIQKYEEVNKMTIHSDVIRIGKAHEEGRAPSHDGEYLTVYYRPCCDDYIVTDNAGIAWTSNNEDDILADAEGQDWEDEVRRQVTEARRIVRDNAGDPDSDLAPAARDIASEWGWFPAPETLFEAEGIRVWVESGLVISADDQTREELPDTPENRRKAVAEAKALVVEWESGK